MSKPKRQHYVPKAYLKQWEDPEKLIWLYDKTQKTVAHRNKDSVLYEEDLYSLTLLELKYLPPEQQVTFFEPLKSFSVYLDDKELDLIKIVENMTRFNDFIIKNAKGRTIGHRQKEDLLEKILKNKHPLIEEKYNEIESKWPDVVNFFEDYRNMVFQNNITLPEANIFKMHADNLLRFILSTYTRNPNNFLRMLERVEPKYNFQLNEWQARTVFEKMQLLHLIDEYPLFDMENYDIHLIFTTTETPFLTNDNPVTIKGIKIENCGFTGIFWFPISPKILVSLSKKKNKDQLFINYHIIGEETVKDFNKIIRQFAEKYFISSVNINDNDFKFIYN